jgi:hypothetical protein
VNGLKNFGRFAGGSGRNQGGRPLRGASTSPYVQLAGIQLLCLMHPFSFLVHGEFDPSLVVPCVWPVKEERFQTVHMLDSFALALVLV